MNNRPSKSRFRLIGLLLALLVAGCAFPVPQHGHLDFRKDLAAEVFSTGLEAIQTYYIKEVDISSLAVAGLTGLSEIEPDFTIERTHGVLRVHSADRLVAEFPLPSRDDVPRWSMLSAAVIDIGRAAHPSLAKLTGEEIYRGLFDAALADLDGYTRYVGARAAVRERQQRQGYTGIGVRIENKQGVHLITRVFEDSPAARAGLRPGDTISHINGRSVDDRDTAELARLLRGPAGSRVALIIVRAGTSRNIGVHRGHVIQQSVHVSRKDNLLTARIDGFNEETAQTLASKIDVELDGAKPTDGLILDLRGNRGGVLTNAVDLSDLFVEDGHILATDGRHPLAIRRYDAHRANTLSKLPVIALIDDESASAAEAVAATLQDRGRALVIGARSYGKGSVQMIVNLPNEGELILTWARMIAPSGYDISRFGVIPVLCLDDLAGIAEIGGRKLETITAIGATRAGLRRQADDLSPRDQDSLLNSCRLVDASPTDDALELAHRLLGQPELHARLLELAHIAHRD